MDATRSAKSMVAAEDQSMGDFSARPGPEGSLAA